MRTVCHNCEGRGYVVVPVLAVSLRENLSGTAEQHVPCRPCGGTGWLKGFVPPV